MKKKEKKEVKSITWIYGVILIGLVFGILIFIMLTKDDKNMEAHCKKAICNDDNSVCRKFDIDSDGNTITTWVGSCKK